MMASPTIAELRDVCQPPSTMLRANAEHWAGRLYMRRASIYATRGFVRIGLTPNAITGVMVLAGVLAGAALLLPGLAGAILAALLIQAYLLLDCSDGEVARWRGVNSVKGVYLDRVGHYLTDAAVLAALGFRAADLHANGWAILGLTAALAAILIKAETDLVDAARAHAGMPAATEDTRDLVSPALQTMRSRVSSLRIHRIIGAIEASLLIAAAAIVDAVRGDLFATRLLLVAITVVAVAQVVLHLVSILTSRRLA